LIAVVAFVAACGRTVGTGTGRATEGLVSDDKNNQKGAPLIKAEDPPTELPTVELVRWRGDQVEVIQQGVRYAGEWIFDGKLQRAEEPLPMPWPEAARSPVRDLFVSFGPVAKPEFIEVRVFGEEIDPNGLPVGGEPIHAVECALTDPNTPHCIETRHGRVGVALAVPGGGLRHVTAWASWDVPVPMRQRLGLETGDVYSAWLFKVHA
jgi:hypothetical protein